MTDKVYEVSVMLSAPELKQPNNGYRLENIENIINLFTKQATLTWSSIVLY